MVFDKHKAKDIERAEIRQAVESHNAFQNDAREPKREEHYAPLFIKVDKYKELVSDIERVKLFNSAIKRTFSLLNDVNDVTHRAMQSTVSVMTELDKIIANIDSKLLRPDLTVAEHVRDSALEMTNVEQSLLDLEKRLSSIRHELQGLK